MKRLGYIFLVFMTFPIYISAQDWVKFSPPGQPFEILCPGQMKNAEKKLLTEVGEMHPVTWVYQGNENESNYIYSISYVDYPEGTFHADSIELIDEFFKVSMDSHIKDLHGELVYTTPDNYYSFPGLLYRVSYNKNKAVAKSRMILAGDRFYALQVYTISEKSLNQDIDKFLNSFEIKKNKTKRKR